MSNKRLTLNLVANLAQFISNLIIAFYFTPFIVSRLGKEAYGYYALAGNLTGYFLIISIAFTSMASRFISMEWHKGNKHKANIFFNTVFFSNIAVSSVFLIMMILFLIKVESIFEIDFRLLSSVRWLFGLVLFSSIISTSGSVFAVSTFCANRLDLKAVIAMINSLLRVGVLVLLFNRFTPNILFLGITTLIISIVELVANIIFTNRLLPDTKIRIGDYRKKYMMKILSSGIWNSLNQLNTILMNGLDVLITNIIFGPIVAGIVAISKTIPNMIVTLSLHVSSVFIPQFTILFAKNDNENLKSQLSTSFKIISFFSSIVLAGFIVYGEKFYELWLPNEDYEMLYKLTLLSMVSFFSILGTKTMGSLELLTNKLKVPVIVTFVRSIVGLIIVLLFIEYTEYGIYAIVGVSSILEFFYDFFFSVNYDAHCIGFKRMFFYIHKFEMFIATFMLVIVFSMIYRLFPIRNFQSFILSVVICLNISFIINLFIFFDEKQRGFLFNKISNKIVSVK